MAKSKIAVSSVVKFRAKVYSHPYSPYYDKYKGHLFVVKQIRNDHIELACISDPSIKVNGSVHEDELLQV